MAKLPKSLRNAPQNLLDRLSEVDIKKIRQNELLEDTVAELLKLQIELNSDVAYCIERGLDEKWQSQFWRRALFRAVFAHIEGILYQLKQIAFQTQGTRFDCNFALAEVALLKEETYSLNENGTIRIKTDDFPRFKSNFRFVFSIVIKAFQLQFRIDFDNDSGWSQLNEALKIRNRLTHPKESSQLIVTDKELETLNKVDVWFASQVQSLFGEITQVFSKGSLDVKREGAEQRKQMFDKAHGLVAQLQNIEFTQTFLNKAISQTDISSAELDEALSRLEKIKQNFVEAFKDLG